MIHRWCKYCEDYVPGRTFADHVNQHELGMNSDAKNRRQYTGNIDKKSDDYMICVLHQKKCPCPVKSCNYKPFGVIRKSYMIRCSKGILRDDKPDPEREKRYMNYPMPRVSPFFPHTDANTGEQLMIPIDMETKTVTIMGVPIFLRI